MLPEEVKERVLKAVEESIRLQIQRDATLELIRRKTGVRSKTSKAEAQPDPSDVRVEKLSQGGCVYLVRCEGFCKIGWTDDILNRWVGVKSKGGRFLVTDNPFECTLLNIWLTIDPKTLEKILHEYLSLFRRRGEWFELPERLLKDLESISEEADLLSYLSRNVRAL